MKVTELVSDDDAVSPVIGVILMVAITVILAAVIGTFVLGIGQDQQTTPSASFDFDSGGANTQVNVTHSGGDSFTNENSASLTLSYNGTSGEAWDGTSASSWEVSAGNTTTTDNAVAGGATLRVVWEAPGGSKTNTVGSFEQPSS